MLCALRYHRGAARPLAQSRTFVIFEIQSSSERKEAFVHSSNLLLHRVEILKVLNDLLILCAVDILSISCLAGGGSKNH